MNRLCIACLVTCSIESVFGLFFKVLDSVLIQKALVTLIFKLKKANLWCKKDAQSHGQTTYPQTQVFDFPALLPVGFPPKQSQVSGFTEIHRRAFRSPLISVWDGSNRPACPVLAALLSSPDYLLLAEEPVTEHSGKHKQSKRHGTLLHCTLSQAFSTGSLWHKMAAMPLYNQLMHNTVDKAGWWPMQDTPHHQKKWIMQTGRQQQPRSTCMDSVVENWRVKL